MHNLGLGSPHTLFIGRFLYYKQRCLYLLYRQVVPLRIFLKNISHYEKKENYNLSSADYKYKSARPIFHDELFLKQDLTRLTVHVEDSI